MSRPGGVSHQTVSRVINRMSASALKPEKGQKRLPSWLSTQRDRPLDGKGHTCTLACFSPNLTDFTFASIIEGAETKARKQVTSYFRFCPR